MTTISPLNQLADLGQSYWLDNLTRQMMDSGKLKHRIDEEGLAGITSNPATFSKAIAKSNDYDSDIWRLFSDGLDAERILTELMISDVQRACDILHPVYERTKGVDGYVSIEVDPRLARHTEATIEAARDLFTRVDRSNCYIKIPGTPEGLPAIEQALFEGIKVNITLLFSVDRYHAVATAYQRAMQRRVSAGEPIDEMHSVASFFLSRIDVLVDQLLQHRILPRENPRETEAGLMLGKSALFEARRAYAAFEELFNQEEWKNLETNHGANLQRPLWASTSTKVPEYSDTMYVDALIADHTVSTMPESTIEAFASNGRAHPEAIRHIDLQDANKHREKLKSMGIDPGCVPQRLEDEGIQKFIDPQEAAFHAIRDTDNEPE